MGRNANHIRFRKCDMYACAESFVGSPFRRNHDTADIGARDGTVIRSWMQPDPVKGDAMRQTIRLTTQRGMRDFLEGIIDRFSIGWYWQRVECSICGQDWLECEHRPGRIYRMDDHDVVCELVFIEPWGKETSAVNAPAVRDTTILAASFLNDLLNQKEGKTVNGYKNANQIGQTTMQNSRQAEQSILLPKGVSVPATTSMQDARLEPANDTVRAHSIDDLIAASGLPANSQSLLRLACTGRSA